MQNNSLQNFNDALDESTKQYKANAALLAKLNKSVNIFEKEIDDGTEAAEKAKETQKKIASAVGGTIVGLTNFSKSLANGKGSFTPLTEVITLTTKVIGSMLKAFPIAGSALKAVAEGAGEVANLMIERFNTVYGVFEKISDSGVVSSFEELLESQKTMRLGFEDMGELLAKHSQNLALFAGSAVKGREELEKIGANSVALRLDFQKLGVSSKDFTDYQLSYINQQTRYGNSQKQTIDQLQTGAVEYIKELDAISKLTGVSRKDLQKEIDARQTDARYRAYMLTATKKQQENSDKAVKMMFAMAPGHKQGLQDMLSGNITTAAAKTLQNVLSVAGIDAVREVRKMNAGQQSPVQLIQKVMGGFKIATERIGPLAAQMGDQTAVTKEFASTVDGAQWADKNLEELQKEYEKKQAENLADKESEGAKLAKTKQALEQAQVNIDALAVNSKLVASSMEMLSSGILSITNLMYKGAGLETDELTKANIALDNKKKEVQASRAAISKLDRGELPYTEWGLDNWGIRMASNTASQLTFGRVSPSYFAKLLFQRQANQDEEIKKLQEAADQAAKNKEADKNQGSGGGGSGGSSGSAPSGGAPAQSSGSGADAVAPSTSPQAAPGSASGMVGGPKDPGAYSGLKIGGKYPGEAIAGGPSSAKLIGIARQLQAAYPGGTFNAFNDLYPGHKNSPHSKGLAFDYSLPGYPAGKKIPVQLGEKIKSQLISWGASGAIDEYNNASGLATGGHIHAQVSARTGGIFNGPNSGYLAELHGDEVVAPVGNQALNTSVLGGSSGSSNTDLSDVYEEMASKMDKLLSIMEMSADTQRQNLRSRFA